MAYSGEELNDHVAKLQQTISEETVKATASLFHLLRRVEDVRRAPSWPTLPELKIHPIQPASIEGIIQIAFKGWVCEVFNGIWEYRRHQFVELFGKNAIPVETDFMGDFRHVRNDLFKARKATKGNCGRCKVVKWFKPGDPIILKLDHVLEFLHQMGYLNGAAWQLRDDIDPKDFDSSQIRLLSIRTTAGPDGEHGETRHMLSCVFGDGVFGYGPSKIVMSDEEFDQAIIDKEGNVSFPQGKGVHKEWLYYHSLQALRRPIIPGSAGPGMAGPWYRIAKVDDDKAADDH